MLNLPMLIFDMLDTTPILHVKGNPQVMIELCLLVQDDIGLRIHGVQILVIWEYRVG